MLGTKLLLTLLPLVVTVTAQNSGWRFNRPFSRFPPRIISRPIPIPVQNVATSAPTPAPASPVQVTSEAKPNNIVPSTRSPLILSYVSPSQRSPMFWRPRPWSQPPSNFRPNSIYPNSPLNTPKPNLSVVYPQNYKPASTGPALVGTSPSSSRPQVISGSQSNPANIGTTAVANVNPEFITPKPTNNGAAQWNARPIPPKPEISQPSTPLSDKPQSEVQLLAPSLPEKPGVQPSLEIEKTSQPSQNIPQPQVQPPAHPQPELVLQPPTQPPLGVSQPSGQPTPQPEVSKPDLQPPTPKPSVKPQPEISQPNQGNPRFLGQNPWSKPIWNFITKPISNIPWVSTTAKPLINRITAALKPVFRPSPPSKPEVSQPSIKPPIEPQPEVSQPAIEPSPKPQPEVPQPTLQPLPQPQPEIENPALQPSAQPQIIPPNQENPRSLGQNPWSKPIWNFVTKPISKHPWIPSTIKPLIPTPKPVYKPIITSPRQSPRKPAGPGLTELMDYQCAQPNGYFPVPHECDTFIECKNYVPMHVVCPDGLHFNPNTVWPEYPCDYPSIVRCGADLESQLPQPTSSCPRQNGYFPSISGDCGKYIICHEGKATEMTCPSGLAFNYEQSICDWPANVPSCNPDVFKGFTCPAPGIDKNEKPSDFIFKYRYNKSCKSYIACQRGSPRLLSCDHGFSYDDVTQSCIDSDLVTDCI